MKLNMYLAIVLFTTYCFFEKKKKKHNLMHVFGKAVFLSYILNQRFITRELIGILFCFNECTKSFNTFKCIKIR